MRVVAAAALTTAALLLSSMASAQGIGDVAAKEREKRKANPPPVKVITENDIAAPPAKDSWGKGTSGATGGSYSGTGVAAAAGSSSPVSGPGTTPTGAKADETKPLTVEEQMQKDEEERQKAEAAWRTELDAAQKEVETHQQNVGRLTDQLNDFRYGFNTPSVARSQADLEEAKTKLAEAQARVDTLQAQGRNEGYR